jgi:hypothetical protein
MGATSCPIALLLLAASAPAVSAPPAPSGDWRVVVNVRDDDVGGIIGFADAGTLQLSGSTVSFWLEYRLERDLDGLDGARGYFTGDCGTYAYASTDVSLYAGSMRLVEQVGVDHQLTAEPGTNVRAAMESVCAGRFLTGRVDPIAHAKSVFVR